MSELADLLEAVRDLYMRRFEEVRVELAASGREFMLEPALLNAEGGVARDGALSTGARLDAIILEGGSYEKVSVDSDRLLSFEPEVFGHDGAEIVISPFQWDYFRLRTDGAFEPVCGALAAWFDKAFGAAAGEVGGNDSIHGVAHFISDPEADGDTIACIVDLGTAPVAALLDLFDRLRDAGARRVELGRTDT